MKVMFVHLGQSKVPWLMPNIERQLSIFPAISVILVSDNLHLLKRAQRLGIDTHYYKLEPEVDNVLANLTKNMKFRNSFWRYSLERLLAIEQAHRQFPYEQLLHVESDVILMPSFPWKSFENVDRLHWLRASADADCAALLFSPSIESSKWLRREILARLRRDPNHTDMTILNSIWSNNPLLCEILPSSTEAILSDSLIADSKSKEIVTRFTDRFEGIFDVISIGMWLTGESSRNTGGHILRYQNLYSPQFYEFSSNSLDIRGGKLLINQSPAVTVHNLHIYSKNLKYFGKNWYSHLERSVEESKTLSNSSSFSIYGYLGAVVDIHQSTGKRPIVTMLILLKVDRIPFLVRLLRRRRNLS